MRSLLLTVVALCACGTPPDPLVGSFNFTLNCTEMTTSPNMSNVTTTGTGTLAITHGVADKSYDLTVAQSGTNACLLRGTRAESDPYTINILAAQMCNFEYPNSSGGATATINSGSAKVTLGP